MEYSGPKRLSFGEPLKGTDTDGNLINDDILGKVYVFPANDFVRGVDDRLTGKQIKAVAVRNTSGAALLGQRIGAFATDAGVAAAETVDGYADTLAQGEVGLIDPWLDSNGCADDDIFLLIVQGPAYVLLPHVGAAFNGDISVGAPLVSATAATSGATTSGRVSNVTLPGQTGATQAFSMAHNVLAKALSAATTAQSTGNVSILVDMQRPGY